MLHVSSLQTIPHLHPKVTARGGLGAPKDLALAGSYCFLHDAGGLANAASKGFMDFAKGLPALTLGMSRLLLGLLL